MKKCFKDRRFSPAVVEIIRKANAVLHEYSHLKIRLTLRQIYYQMIGRDFIPDSWIDDKYNTKHNLQLGTKNTLKNYKRHGRSRVRQCRKANRHMGLRHPQRNRRRSLCARPTHHSRNQPGG